MLDTLEQVVPDQLSGGGLKREASPQLRRLDVGAVPGLLHPRPRRVIRPAPAGLQVAPRGEDMHVSAAAALAVHHGRPGVAVRL